MEYTIRITYLSLPLKLRLSADEHNLLTRVLLQHFHGSVQRFHGS